jgi:hypothetical protein
MALCWPLQMPPTPKAVLISLADNANDQGYCWPSIARISERTCFSKRAVIDAIAWLEQHGILAADRVNGRHTTYVINPADFVQPVREAHRCEKSTGADAASEPVQQAHQPVHLPHQPVRQVHTNHQEPKRTVKKSNRQKAVVVLDVLLPGWLAQDLWEKWVEHRIAIKKPLSQLAADMSISELADLRAQGFDPEKVIKASIVSGWAGLFPLKQQAAKGGPTGQGGNRQQQLEERNRAAADEWLNSRNSHA